MLVLCCRNEYGMNPHPFHVVLPKWISRNAEERLTMDMYVYIDEYVYAYVYVNVWVWIYGYR